MKLLVFLNGDAPQTTEHLAISENGDVVFNGRKALKVWNPQVKNEGESEETCYAISKNGKVQIIEDVMVMKASPFALQPKGITENELAGVSFKNKRGKAYERARQEFGDGRVAVRPSKPQDAKEEKSKKKKSKRERDE